MRVRMVLFLLASLLVCGCGGSSGDDERPSGGGSSAQAADGTSFPQTVEHNFGSTTVAKKPEPPTLAPARVEKQGRVGGGGGS